MQLYGPVFFTFLRSVIKFEFFLYSIVYETDLNCLQVLYEEHKMKNLVEKFAIHF